MGTSPLLSWLYGRYRFFYKKRLRFEYLLWGYAVFWFCQYVVGNIGIWYIIFINEMVE